MTFADKVKLIRKTCNMTQADFAQSIGISRSNLSGIERGTVSPTPLFINCVSYAFHVDKDWLTDDQNEDVSMLNDSTRITSLIMEKYGQLDDRFKAFIYNQIVALLEIQEEAEPM